MKRFVAVLSSGPLLVFSLVAIAATTSDPVIVTATRTAQTADESLAAITVITRADIERQQASSVQDLLRGTPGLAMANNGGPGKFTSVFLRGTESDHVLVLIDGVKVGSATLGTAAFQNIPVEQIERIEIVRGPRSSLYGSEAIGGVIQIFTRKGGGALTPFFSVGGGSYHTYNTSAGVSGGGDRGWFNLSASGSDTEGFNACRGEPGVGGCFTNEPDRDGYTNVSGSARAGYRFANGAEGDVNVLRAKGKNQFDGGFVNELESMQQVVGSRLRFSPMAPWNVTLAAGRSRDESDNFKDGTFRSRFDTERDTLSFQNDVSIGTRQLLTLGLDYLEDSITSTQAYAVTSRDNEALFVQYQAGIGRHDLQASVRRDDNEQFGHHNTGGLVWGHALSDTLRWTASYSTAFKAPTFNELYWPYSAFTDSAGFTNISRGNPDLSPEKSKTTELGLRYKLAASSINLSAYETKARDLIDWATTPTGATEFTTAPANIDHVRIRGLEAAFDTRLADWEVKTSLTLLDPKNRSAGTNQGNVLPRRAEQALRLDLDRALGKYRVGTTLFAEGRRFDDLANTHRLGGYATIDLRAEYLFTKAWRAQARVENLFDKDYETAAFYNQPGRSVYLTLRYQP